MLKIYIFAYKGLMPQAHEKTSEQSLESGEERLQKYESFLEEEKQTVLRKFVIHMSSQFDVDGCNAGSRLVTWVDQQLHTFVNELQLILFGG